MSLFGHHHATPTLASRAAEVGTAVLHLPLAVWLTIIPIAGGIMIAYVTHRLNLQRDRLALARDDERRRADERRAALRACADLTFRLNRHRQALRAAVAGDTTRLESEHRALIRRATESDVIDLLGQRYLPFMAVLQREEAELAKTELHGEALTELERALAPFAELVALPSIESPQRSA